MDVLPRESRANDFYHRLLPALGVDIAPVSHRPAIGVLFSTLTDSPSVAGPC